MSSPAIEGNRLPFDGQSKNLSDRTQGRINEKEDKA